MNYKELAKQIESLKAETADKQEQNILSVAAGIVRGLEPPRETLSSERFKELIEEGRRLRKEFDEATAGMRNITDEDLKRRSR